MPPPFPGSDAAVALYTPRWEGEGRQEQRHTVFIMYNTGWAHLERMMPVVTSVTSVSRRYTTRRWLL